MSTWLAEVMSAPTAHRIGWALVHLVWQGAVVAALLWLALRLLAGRRPQIRWATSCVALAVIAVLPVVTAMLIPVAPSSEAMAGAAREVPAPPAGDVRPPVAFGAEHARDSAPLSGEGLPSASPTEPAENPVTIGEASADEPVTPSERATHAMPWRAKAERLLRPILPWAVGLWIVGVVVLSLWHAGGLVWLRRLKRRGVLPIGLPTRRILDGLLERLGVSRPVGLLESTRLAVPAVVGWLKPVILLPTSALSGLTPEQIEAILAHELTHIRRHDCLVRLLQAAVETLLFYHPAVWWVSRRISQESEQCCDDEAVDICGDRRHYALALASMAALGAGKAPLALAATGGDLLPRIRRLASADKPGTLSLGRCLSGLVALVAVVVVTMVVGASPTAQEERKAECEQDAVTTKPAEAFKASFESLSVDITSTWAWNRTITIKGDGSYTFDLQQLRKVPGMNRMEVNPNRYVATYRIAPAHLRQLEKLIGAAKWLAGGGKIKHGLMDGTKYTLTVAREGKATTTTCYGDQEQAYADLITFLRGVNRQEWLLYQFSKDAGYRSHPEGAIRSEIDALLSGKGTSTPYAPIWNLHRFVPPLAAMLAAPAGRKNDELIAAAELMGYLKIESQRKALEVLAADRTIKEPRVRAEAVGALARLGGPKAIRALLALTDDDDRQINDALARAFVQLRGPEAIGVLTRLAQKNRVAALALIRLGPAAVPAIVDVLNRKHDLPDRSDYNLIRQYADHWKSISQPVDRRVIDAIYARVETGKCDRYTLDVLKLARRPFVTVGPRETFEGFLKTLASNNAHAIAEAMTIHFTRNDPGKFLLRAKAGKLKITAMHAERNTAWIAMVDADDKRSCYLVWMNLDAGRVWEVSAAMPRKPDRLKTMLKKILDEHPDAKEVPAASFSAKKADVQVKTDWSTPIEGVEMRLKIARKTWRADEVPALKWDVRNTGGRQFLEVASGQRYAQLAVDGVWYRWPISLRGAAMADLSAGKSLENQLVTVSPIWSLAKPEELPWKMGGDGFLDPAEARAALQLAPGKHTIRLAVILEPSRVVTGKGFRVVSRPLEITVTALPAGQKVVWPPQGKLPQAVKDALFATVIPLQESTRPRQPKMKEWIARAVAQTKAVAVLAKGTPLHPSAKRLADTLAALQNAVTRGDPAKARKEFAEAWKAYSHLVSVLAGETPPVAARLPITRPADPNVRGR